jgi:GDPmannose 4,6-dehydratase
MNRTAVIVGSGGQDGLLLTDYLAAKGYDIVGVSRGEVRSSKPSQTLPATDIRDVSAVDALVRQSNPHEIYFLAAHHHSSQDKTGDDGALFRDSQEIHQAAFLNFLEAARRHAPASRTFYAASSHVFGMPDAQTQDETTPMQPVSPYAITKAAGLGMCRYYREVRGLFVAGGILYNHESPLRSAQFISRKLARAAAEIKRGLTDTVTVGNLEAMTDWSYAPDFVDAMWRILALDVPDTFIVASGVRHSVRDMAKACFDTVGLDYQKHVGIDGMMLQRNTSKLLGNPAKLRQATGWKPSLSFSQMMARMVEAELDRLDGK